MCFINRLHVSVFFHIKLPGIDLVGKTLLVRRLRSLAAAHLLFDNRYYTLAGLLKNRNEKYTVDSEGLFLSQKCSEMRRLQMGVLLKKYIIQAGLRLPPILICYVMGADTCLPIWGKARVLFRIILGTSIYDIPYFIQPLIHSALSRYGTILPQDRDSINEHAR